MNQLAIDFTAVPRCSVPASETQLGTLLRALQRGERLTVAVAMSEYGVYALSQRMGDLKRMGWPVQSRAVSTNSGKRISEYSMEAH
jgi:hypothetical protein